MTGLYSCPATAVWQPKMNTGSSTTLRMPPNIIPALAWGTAEDIKPFMDPVFENNIIHPDGTADDEQPPQGPQDSQE